MMIFGKKGMSGESKSVVAILMIFGILFVVAFAFSFFSYGGGPPTGPDAVIKYYDDLLKGEYGGKKYSPTSLVIVLFIPLITSFSLIWVLTRILPVFQQRANRSAAAVLAMGLSIYVVPTMSWMIMQIFPPLLGVSAILIGVAMLIMAIFILVSTVYQFGDLHWGGGGGGGGDDHDYDSGGGGWNPFGRRRRDRDEPINVEEEEAEDKSLVQEIEDLKKDVEAIPAHEVWRDLFAENMDWSKVTDQDFKRRKELCIEYLETLLRIIKKIYSMLRRPWGRLKRVPKEEKIKLEAQLVPVEQQILRMIAGLRGIETGRQWMGIRGKFISWLNDLLGSGRNARESMFGYITEVPTPKEAEEKRKLRARSKQKSGSESTTEQRIKEDEEIKNLREIFRASIEGIKRITSDTKNYKIISPSDIDKLPAQVRGSFSDVAMASKGIVITANKIEEALRRNETFENLWKDYFSAKLNVEFEKSIANLEQKITILDGALKKYINYCEKTHINEDPQVRIILTQIDEGYTAYLKQFDDIRDIKNQNYLPAAQQAKKKWG